jgi:hypothetical protein
VPEIINADAIHKPSWHPKRSSSLGIKLLVPVPIIINKTSGGRNRLHRIALGASGADHPPEPSPDDEHEDDQAPDADAEVVSPGCWKGFA